MLPKLTHLQFLALSLLSGEVSSSEIADLVNMEIGPKLYQFLARLRTAKLVNCRKDYHTCYYSITAKGIHEVEVSRKFYALQRNQ